MASAVSLKLGSIIKRKYICEMDNIWFEWCIFLKQYTQAIYSCVSCSACVLSVSHCKSLGEKSWFHLHIFAFGIYDGLFDEVFLGPWYSRKVWNLEYRLYGKLHWKNFNSNWLRDVDIRDVEGQITNRSLKSKIILSLSCYIKKLQNCLPGLIYSTWMLERLYSNRIDRS